MKTSSLWLRWKRLFRIETWNIGVIERHCVDLEQLIATGRLPDVRWSTWVSPHKYRADPFVWRESGDTRVIFEEYDWWCGRADIRSIRIDGELGANRRIELAGSYHLSYPQIIKCDGATYCVPESAELGAVDLYAWDPESLRWNYRTRLIEERVLDPTLIHFGGAWYMFGTLMGEKAWESLQIWWSHSLYGSWVAHPLSPIKSPSGCSRSAGPIFTSSGRLYRPVQDNSNGYGSGILLHRIDILTPELFSETCVRRLGPEPGGPYPSGLHTLTVDEEFVLVDGKRMVSAVLAPAFKAIWRVSHAIRASRKGRPLFGKGPAWFTPTSSGRAHVG